VNEEDIARFGSQRHWKKNNVYHNTVVIIHTTYCDVNNTIFIHAVGLWTSLNFVNNDCSGSIIDLLICKGESMRFHGCYREKSTYYLNIFTAFFCFADRASQYNLSN